jgi:hypothetical protein
MSLRELRARCCCPGMARPPPAAVPPPSSYYLLLLSSHLLLLLLFPCAMHPGRTCVATMLAINSPPLCGFLPSHAPFVLHLSSCWCCCC